MDNKEKRLEEIELILSKIDGEAVIINRITEEVGARLDRRNERKNWVAIALLVLTTLGNATFSTQVNQKADLAREEAKKASEQVEQVDLQQEKLEVKVESEVEIIEKKVEEVERENASSN